MSQTPPPDAAPPPPPPPPGASSAAGLPGKIRSPWAPILLTIVTLGIYGFVYQYKTFKEMRDYSGEGIGGGLALVLWFICGLVNVFLLPAEVAGLYEGDGKERPVSALTAFWNLIPIAGIIIYFFKVQGALNELWTSKGATRV